MARRLYSVEEVKPIILENDSSGSNGKDSVDLEDDSESEELSFNHCLYCAESHLDWVEHWRIWW